MKPPLFNGLSTRGAGVLLHPTSLPGIQGIGSFGHEARAFIDFLSEAGFRYWQMCPLGPTGYGDSPYQTFSAFAGNPYLIDLKTLESVGLIKWQELEGLKKLSQDKVDFGALYTAFWPVLRVAYERYLAHPQYISETEHKAFEKRNALWLHPYAAFMACKEHFNGSAWTTWPKEARTYTAAKASGLLATLEKNMGAWVFYEYLFWSQWQAIRAYAKTKNIELIGDIPIFVAADSADVWAWPEIFNLDKQGLPASQAGVPPDYFSEKGQLWGNPLYDWETMKEGGYKWWLGRLERNFALFDVIRLDHFRGFDSYWEVPAGALDAKKGKWQKGPGIAFFEAIKEKFPEARLIAEDLGDLTPGVKQLLTETGLPGMAILQFAFGGDASSSYLPHNHKQNLVVYPGSHDNDTSLGWYTHAPEKVKDHVRRYLRVTGNESAWDLIRAALESTAGLAIIQMQDLLSLSSEARMNLPGKPDGNWSWRYTTEALSSLQKQGTAAYLKTLNTLYGR